jgi:hypothetical protein
MTTHYEFRPDSLTVSINQAYDLILNAAYRDGVIDTATLERLVQYRAVATDQENLFSKIHKCLFGQKDKLHVRVVRVADKGVANVE